MGVFSYLRGAKRTASSWSEATAALTLPLGVGLNQPPCVRRTLGGGTKRPQGRTYMLRPIALAVCSGLIRTS